MSIPSSIEGVAWLLASALVVGLGWAVGCGLGARLVASLQRPKP